MFVAPAGKVLVDADYSQIELRLLAHIAGDKAMIDGFRSGEDIHTITAAQVFGVARSEVCLLYTSPPSISPLWSVCAAGWSAVEIENCFFHYDVIA